jgi:DNA-binding response OmpR family regulator
MNIEKKVIAVDDDPNLLTLIEDSLSTEGYEVLTADNGYSALTLIKEVLPGLVILDIVLPRMDGLKVCRKLKEDVKTRNIPVLVMSGQPRREHIIELLRMGIKNFLAKPFNVADLVKRVQQLYIDQPASGELTHLKIRYSAANEFLNVKLSGALSFEDIPVLIKNVEQHITDRINKVIMNVGPGYPERG